MHSSCLLFFSPNIQFYMMHLVPLISASKYSLLPTEIVPHWSQVWLTYGTFHPFLSVEIMQETLPKGPLSLISLSQAWLTDVKYHSHGLRKILQELTNKPFPEGLLSYPAKKM